MPAKKLLLGTVIGGLVLFGWGWVSHSFLPFYNNAFLGFENEDEVVTAILANAPASGIYFVPYVPINSASETDMQAAMDRRQRGPFMLASIRLGEMGSIGKYMIIQLVTDMLSAFFVCLILLRAKEMSMWHQIVFVEFIALTIFAAQSLPHWNWYEFSTSFTMAEGFDLVAGWFLAGVVFAKLNMTKANPA